MKKLRIYFGCALAHGPQEYQLAIATFKEKLSKIPWIILLEFCKPEPGSQQSTLEPCDIYKNDIIDCVGTADVVLGDLTFPSTGLGGELMASMQVYNLPTMMFAAKNVIDQHGNKKVTIVSKLWLGAPAHNPKTTFDWYENSIEELFEKIVHDLQNAYEKMNFNEILET